MTKPPLSMTLPTLELGESYLMPGGTLVHAELLIDDSIVMVKDAQDDKFNALLCAC